MTVIKQRSSRLDGFMLHYVLPSLHHSPLRSFTRVAALWHTVERPPARQRRPRRQPSKRQPEPELRLAA